MRRQDGPGDEKDYRDTGPHQRAGALLIFERGKAGLVRSAEVDRIGYPVGKDEQSGKHVARQRGKKEI
jgi:hypothetical protein